MDIVSAIISIISAICMLITFFTNQQKEYKRRVTAEANYQNEVKTLHEKIDSLCCELKKTNDEIKKTNEDNIEIKVNLSRLNVRVDQIEKQMIRR